MYNEALIKENEKYLKLLALQYPTVQSVSARIINLQAYLDLPKGTEHFMSDLHGEYEAFSHILNNASGVIREKVDAVYGNTVGGAERAALATLIYYPQLKLEQVKATEQNLEEWYRITLHRLIEVCRIVTSKYTRETVRQALPKDFYHIIDELLHANYEQRNKEQYYDRIIFTIIDIDRADSFIVALCELIKRLAVDRLHIIGDIFDRGPRPDIILDALMAHHSVDIQWGNHDILWMGAAAGGQAAIANVLNNCLAYNNLDVVETGYGINLRPLAIFAQETYRSVDCSCFYPKLLDDKSSYNPKDLDLVARIHKAIVVLQLKLEGQIIRRHPEYYMDDRLLLGRIDTARRTVEIDGKTYPIRDAAFPTVDPEDPYRLTAEEQEVMDRLQASFERSEKLQRQIKFLYSKGGMYLCHNGNLLYHGCIPLNPDGSFAAVAMGNRVLSGRQLLDYAESLARQGYFAPPESERRQQGRDFLWYLWCGRNSPVFGRNRMTTFERYLVEDRSTWAEPKNPYYTYYNDYGTVCRILTEFGLDPATSHIVNGHVPVRTKDGESPIKAGGRLIVIDGGFCRAYQPTTGIAGYTLIYNSHGLRLISHQPFQSRAKAVEENGDIHSTSTILETVPTRLKIADTDDGRKILGQIEDLKMLLRAYRMGLIKEDYRLPGTGQI